MPRRSLRAPCGLLPYLDGGQRLLAVALLDADVDIIHTRVVLFLLGGVRKSICETSPV